MLNTLRFGLITCGLLSACLVCGAPLTFEKLGDPVRLKSLGFSLLTQDPTGYYVAWGGFLENGLGRTALIGVRIDTGQVIWNDLSGPAQGKLSFARGADGNVYAFAGSPGRFWRYDIVKHELQDLGAPAPAASYYSRMSLAPDGRLYLGSYPAANLMYCDTHTGEVKDLGRLSPDERECYIYPAVAVSADNIVYCPVGLHHKELWAYNPATGTKTQILPENLTQEQGTVTIWRAIDGKVYGTSGSLAFVCHPDRIEQVQATVSEERESLQAGDLRVGGLDGAGVLTLNNVKTGQVTGVPTNYEGSRARIFAVSCERDGKLYGSTLLPGNSFSYDTMTGEFCDLGILGSGECQVYDTFNLPEGLLLASYFGAKVDFYSPNQPLAAGINPRHLGSAGGQERPVQWCQGPDGMLYTGTEPAKGRLGGAILRVNPQDMSLKVWPTPIANQSIEYLAPVPETGELLCASSIQGGSSAIPTEKTACLFLWDPVRDEVTFKADPFPGTKTYGRLVRAANGLIYGLAEGKYYAFDPVKRSVVFTGTLPVKSIHFPELNDEPVGPKGLIYGLGDDAVFAIDPADHSAQVIARDPSLQGAFGFMVTKQGVLYYGSSATLYRCNLLP